MNGWGRGLRWTAVTLLALTAGLLLFFAGEYSGKVKEEKRWQENMIEKGLMFHHPKSGKIHWTSKEKSLSQKPK